MKSSIYAIVCVFLVLLSYKMDAMNQFQRHNANPAYRVDKNLLQNYNWYKVALGRRFNIQQRQCSNLTPYVETAADFIPFVGAALVPTGLTNKLVNKLPFLDISTKNKVASSLNRALLLNLLPATYNVAAPILEFRASIAPNEPIPGSRQLDDPREHLLTANPRYTSYVAIPSDPYDSVGKLKKSPRIDPSLLFIGTYMTLDLTAQSETVAGAINAIPGVKKASQFLNKHVSVESGAGTAIVQFAIVAIATSVRG